MAETNIHKIKKCIAKCPTWFGEVCGESIEKIGDKWKHIRRFEKTYDHEAES